MDRPLSCIVSQQREEPTLKKDRKTRQADQTQLKAYHETPMNGDKTFLRRKYKGEDDDLIQIPLDLDEDTELHDEYLMGFPQSIYHIWKQVALGINYATLHFRFY